MQLKRHSLIESISNVAVGYGIALLSQIILYPIYNIHVSIFTNIYLGLWFTVISIIRSYVLRRIFTKRTEHGRT